MDQDKQEIINRFNNNVRGKKSNTSNSNQKHDGKDGHWLERQMGVQINNRTQADLFGYEMKNQTISGKTTFGDWSADTYIFSEQKYFLANTRSERRDEFLKVFGTYKSNTGKYSWSGKVVPKINTSNQFGQKLVIDANKDILVFYDYSKDSRSDKNTLISPQMQINDLILAQWKHDSMKERVDSKFNDKGWFKCLKNRSGIYTSIVFGKPIPFDDWIDFVKQGIVFFDSGMKQEESRNYSLWRASNSFWTSLIIDTY